MLTQRLLLRRWRPEDAEPLRNLSREPEVAGWFPAAMTLNDAERLIDAHGGAFDRGEPALLAVELRERPGLLGFCGLSQPTFEADFADNLRSRAVMERLGMRREPGADFDHPRVPVGHPLRAHVLYRLSAETWAVTERTGRPGWPRV